MTGKRQVRVITDTTSGAAVEDRPERTNHDWAYTYSDTKPHQVTQIGPSVFAHDANGNVSVQCLPGHFSCPGERVPGKPPEGLPRYRQFSWSEDNWLRAVVDGNGQRATRFIYDAGGQRVAKLGFGGESLAIGQFYSQRAKRFGTKHIFLGDQRIASKVMAVSNGVEQVGDVPPGLEGNVNGCEPSGYRPQKCPNILSWPGAWSGNNSASTSATYYYHPDHLGSTSWLTDQHGQVHERIEYFPYGEVWREDREIKQRGPKKRRPNYLFTGKEYDEETGLSYFGARYYDSAYVRWLSADPAGPWRSPFAVNLYQYGAWNPVRYVDPDGRMEFDWLGDALAVERGYVTFEQQQELDKIKGLSFAMGLCGIFPSCAVSAGTAFWSAGVENAIGAGILAAGGEQGAAVEELQEAGWNFASALGFFIGARMRPGTSPLKRVGGSTDDFVLMGSEGNGVVATIDKSGIVEMAIEAPKGALYRGSELFSRMVEHFGEHIKAIRGNWRYGDNLAAVNKLVSEGVPLETAVTRTWTGTQAAKHGFGNATVTATEGAPGQYKYIQVVFTE